MIFLKKNVMNFSADNANEISWKLSEIRRRLIIALPMAPKASERSTYAQNTTVQRSAN